MQTKKKETGRRQKWTLRPAVTEAEETMRYCQRCGAYIPDGLSACVACGYDENRQAKKQGAQATRTKTDSVERREAERRRFERQAADRAWAEAERRRRTEEADFRRRQREAERRAQSRVNTGRTDEPGEDVEQGSRLLSLLGYIGPLFFLPMAFGKDRFARFHGNQSLKLFIASILGHAVGGFLGLGFVVTVLRVILAVCGIKNVLEGKERKLPYIGDWF